MKRIYITYCWQDEKIADILDYHFQQVGIKLIRDKRNLDYSSSIEGFARKMRQSSYNLCVISNEYLKRINCMFEINQLLKDDNFAKKEILPYQEYIYNSLGNAYEKLYEYEPLKEYLLASEKNYLLAVDKNPKYYQALNNLSLLYLMKLHDLSKAKKAITDCLIIAPNYHMALNTLGLICEEEHDYERALEYYMKSYEYSKSYSPPINQIGRILDFEYKNPLCRLYYLSAYDINPRSMVNCFNLGNYYRKYTDNVQEAKKLLDYALSVQHNNILCNMAMGLLELKCKNYLSARDYFSFSLAVNPDYACACFCLAVCEYSTNNSSKAIFLLAEFLKKHKCPYIKDFAFALEKHDANLNRQIDHVLQEYIEYEYVRIPEQISKSLILNPITELHEAYQYIIENFYS